MTDINQRLGFDVGQALQALDKLENRLAGFEKRLGSLATSLNNFNRASGLQGLNNTAGAVTNLGNTTQRASQTVSRNMGRVSKSFQDVGKAGPFNVSLIDKSIETLVRRVLTTQLVVSALSRFKRALADATRSAVEFQYRLAEIQTIGGDATADFGQLADRVRAISDEFNKPLGDVAEGLYQTISNQVGNAAERFEFMADAAQFSRVAVASTEDSVNLLSSAINSYNLDVSEADDVAAKFFKTIELGRTRASELADTFGRVGRLGSQANVAFEEILASVATITISGVRTSEALTQIRGAISGLLKPTTEMKRAIRELGFESATQAVNTLGFQGALHALIGATDASKEAIARLFPRIRGMTGVMNIATDTGGRYAEQLRQIQAATGELLDEKAELILDTNADQVTKRLNKLKNFFTQDFGFEILESINDIANGLEDVFGSGVDATRAFSIAFRGMAASVGLTTTAFGGLIATYALYKAAAAQAAAATAAITANNYAAAASASALQARYLQALAAVKGLTAVAIGAVLVTGFNREVEAAIERASKAFREKRDVQIEGEQQAWDESIRITKEGGEELLKSLNEQLAEERKLYGRRIEDARQASERLFLTLGSIADKIIQARQKEVSDLRKLAEDANQQILASEQRTADLRIKTEDELFQRRIRNLSETRQFVELSGRAQRLADDAARRLSTARTDDQAQKALADFDRARSLNQQADSIARSLKNRGAENSAARQLQRITTQQVNAERQLQQIREQQARNAKEAAEIRRKETADLILRAKKIGQLSAGFDEEGNLVNDEKERARLRAQAIREFESFVRDAVNQDALKARDLIDLTSLTQDLNNSLDGLEIRTLKTAPQALRQIEEEIQSAVGEFRTKFQIEIELLEAAAGKPIRDPNAFFAAAKSVAQSSQRVETLQKQIDKLRADLQANETDTLARLHLGVRQAALGNFVATAFGLGRNSEEELEAVEKLNTLFADIATNAQSASVTTAEVNKLKQSLIEIKGVLDNDSFDVVDSDLQAAQKAIGLVEQRAQKTEKLRDLEKEKANALKGQTESLKDIPGLLDEVTPAAEGYEEPFKSSATSMSDISKALGSQPQALANATKPASTLADEYERGARAAQAMASAVAATSGAGGVSAQATPAAFGRILHRAFGGPAIRYYNHGGFAPQGTDNILAALSKGESVINARSTREFFPEIQAINAGIRPAFREHGGEVNNTTIGDIYVTVKGGETSRQSGRAVAAEIRRELRRGTSSLPI